MGGNFGFEVMAMEWWHYEKNDQKHGPVTFEIVKGLLADGQLHGENLVWTKGMSDWQAVSTVEVFASSISAAVAGRPPRATQSDVYGQPAGALPTSFEAPPANQGVPVFGAALAPVGTTVSPGEQPALFGTAVRWQSELGDHDIYELGASGSQRRPWLRQFARTIDSFFFLVGALTATAILAPSLADSKAAWVIFLSLFAWCFLEAALLSKWATTPGKALFHIRVLRRDGGHMTYGAALRRSLEVWIKGMVVGFSQISFFTQAYAYHKLVKAGATPWDAGREHIVVHRALSPWKATIGSLLYASIIGFCILASVSAL